MPGHRGLNVRSLPFRRSRLQTSPLPGCAEAGSFEPLGRNCQIFSMSNKSMTAKEQRTAIAPLLSVRRGASAIEFYKAAFGATEIFRIEDAKGEVVARLTVDGGEFWLADESPQHFNFSPESLGGGSVRMILTVAEPDAMFARAVAAGAAVVSQVTNQHGWRIGRVVDPFGHHWEIAKPLSEEA